MQTEKNIIVVGGGFAGTALAKSIVKKLPAGYRLVMVSEDSYTTFNPMLAEAVGASIFPAQVVAPLREVLRLDDPRMHSQFVMGQVAAVDLQNQFLTVNSLSGKTKVSFEHLVFAFGNRARTDLIPGMAEFALPLKTVGDAIHIRNIVLRRLARIELETDPVVRKRLGHFVVIGGGFSGSEVAGELMDCLRSIVSFYPGVNARELGVSIIQNIGRLLPELPELLAQKAHKSLTERGVQIHLNLGAASVNENGVVMTNGLMMDAGTVISTIGTRPNALAQLLADESGIKLERGRIITNPDMRLPDHPNLWAIGDCALTMNAYDNRHAPPTAQFASEEGKCAAANIIATISGKQAMPLNYQSRGMMATLGHMRGVALVFGVPVSGLVAWLIWRAYYLMLMPTLGRKVRIYVEWTWGMFFRTDITHLRFNRSEEQIDPPHKKG